MYPGTSRPNQLHHPYTHTPPGSGFATSSQCFPCHVKRSGSRHATSSSSTLHHGRFQATAGDVGALPSTQCSPPHCPMSGDAVGGDPIPVSGSVCTWNHCDASCNGAVDDPHGRANFTAQPIRRSPMHARPWIDQGGQHTLRGTWQPEKRHLSTPECAAHVHGGEHEPLLVLDALSRRVDQLEDALRTKDEQVHNLTNLLRLLQTHLHERDEAHKQDMQDTVAKIQQGVAQQQQQVQEDVSIIQEQLLGVMNEQCASQRHLDGALGKIERYVRHLRIQHPRSEKTTSLQEGNDGTNPTQKLMSCRSCGAVATSGGLTANQVSAESKTDANVLGGVNDADMSEGNMRKAGAGSTGVKSALGGGTTPVPSGLQSPDETEILSLHATEAPLLFVRGLCQACHNKSILREACDALRSEFHEQMEDWKRSYHQWRPTWAEELERSVEEACAHRVNVNRCDILLLVDERVTRVLGEMEQCIKSTNQQTQDTLTERMDRMMERFQRQYVQEFEEVCTRMQHQTEIMAQGMDGAQKRTADQIGTFARTLEEWIETTRKFPAELDRLSEQTEKIRTSLKEILDVHQSTRSVLHNEMEEAKHSHSKTTARIRARLDSHSKDIHLLKEELLRLMTEHITHLSRSQQQHSDTVREMLSVHSLHASEASRRFEDRARAQNTTRSLHPEEGEGNHLLAQNSANDIMNASEVSAIHQVPRAGLRRGVLTPPDLSFTVPPPDLPGSRATRDVTTPQGNVTTSPQKPIAVPIRKRNHKLRSTELDEPLYGSGTKTEHESAGSTLDTFLERSRDRRQELNQLYEQLSNPNAR